MDTNVLVYAYDQDDPVKQSTAIDLLSDLMSARRMILSAQCLNEFFNTVTNTKKPKPLPADMTRRIVEAFVMAADLIVPLDVSTTLQAIDAVPKYSMSFWDALIWAAAKQGGASTLYTEDYHHGRIVEGIRYVNPFLPPGT